MNDWGLSLDETTALDQSLNAPPPPAVEPEWESLTLSMPKNFIDLFKETLTAYKLLVESDKDFPALEAMVLEARNSLPPESLEVVRARKS